MIDDDGRVLGAAADLSYAERAVPATNPWQGHGCQCIDAATHDLLRASGNVQKSSAHSSHAGASSPPPPPPLVALVLLHKSKSRKLQPLPKILQEC